MTDQYEGLSPGDELDLRRRREAEAAQERDADMIHRIRLAAWEASPRLRSRSARPKSSDEVERAKRQNARPGPVRGTGLTIDRVRDRLDAVRLDAVEEQDWKPKLEAFAARELDVSGERVRQVLRAAKTTWKDELEAAEQRRLGADYDGPGCQRRDCWPARHIHRGDAIIEWEDPK